jgi:hypothetical protein
VSKKDLDEDLENKIKETLIYFFEQIKKWKRKIYVL